MMKYDLIRLFKRVVMRKYNFIKPFYKGSYDEIYLHHAFFTRVGMMKYDFIGLFYKGGYDEI